MSTCWDKISNDDHEGSRGVSSTPRLGYRSEKRREETGAWRNPYQPRRTLPEAESIRKINYAEELYICRASAAVCAAVVKIGIKMKTVTEIGTIDKISIPG